MSGEQSVSANQENLTPNKDTMVSMPRSLTAENGAKAALIGEFKINIPMTCSACGFHGAQLDCEVCHGAVNYTQPMTIPWDSIKDIYKAAVDLFHPQPASRNHRKP